VTADQRWAGLFWLGLLLLFFLFIWLLSSIILPFVAGMAIAYFLHPVVDRLGRWGVPRGGAATLVLLLFVLALVLIAMLIWPLLELQTSELANRLPSLVARGQKQLDALLQETRERLAPEDVARLRDMLGAWAASALAWAADVAKGLLTSGRALVNVLWLVFVTPIVAFFLLRDWPRITARVDSWLPRPYAATIREQARLVDATLAGFIHGQVLVSLSLTVYYTLMLTIARLEFALVIGVLVGVLSFIPFVGVSICFILTMGLALLQFGSSWTSVGFVFIIFVVGQTIEGNVLSPKLVGERINLHPVWIIFALLAFGTLFGLLGVLLALPAAAVVGVLVRFALSRYLASPLYDPAANRPPAERR
jgi:predicted PurR-regulated permease PerM